MLGLILCNKVKGDLGTQKHRQKALTSHSLACMKNLASEVPLLPQQLMDIHAYSLGHEDSRKICSK